MTIPKVGDKIYIDSESYITRGEDDIRGGLATVTKVEISECLNPNNRVFVSVEGINGKYNWFWLEQEQEGLKREYGENKAYLDPDYTSCGDIW